MNELTFYLEEAIGKRSSRDIVNDRGELIIPINTVITYDHVILLVKNGIKLNVDDIIDIGEGFNGHLKVIDQTVEQVRDIFGVIRKTKKIPLVDLRNHVIPMIHTASDSQHLLQLFSALQAKDDYTYRHNIAVGVIANLLGKWMKLNHQELLQLTTAALLHDVGKMLIPENILNKPGKLTTEEFTTMKKHTVRGYEMLKETIGINHRQALVALQHHERMDGSGYPFGVKKHDIDLFSRIVAVADVFHAMSSNRVYQNYFPFYQVITELSDEMFGALDPEISLLFIEKTMNALIGNTVLLTDERKGTIVMVPHNKPTQPLIRIEDQFIDLSKEFSLHIKEIVIQKDTE